MELDAQLGEREACNKTFSKYSASYIIAFPVKFETMFTRGCVVHNQVRAQFHKACKQKNLLSMKLLP